jgi:hypothetical protein
VSARPACAVATRPHISKSVKPVMRDRRGAREEDAQEDGGQAQADGDNGRLERELDIVQVPAEHRLGSVVVDDRSLKRERERGQPT